MLKSVIGGTEKSLLLISPNLEYFTFGFTDKPLPMAALTDPYYGKSEEVIQAILMTRIKNALTVAMENGAWAVALPPMAELEAASANLPEDFYFFQADTLARAGRVLKAKQKADAFIVKYGKTSPNYARMIDILAQ